MKKQILNIISILASVGVVCFLFALCVFAWTGPSSTPPNSNVSPPLNIGSGGQSKSGALTVMGGFESTGVSYFASLGGSVGIGTTNPSQKLDVNGYVKGTGVCINSDCRTSWPGGSSPQKWDSGWISVVSNQSYPHSNGLGAIPDIISVYAAKDGNGSHMIYVGSTPGSGNYGFQIYDINSSNFKYVTYSRAACDPLGNLIDPDVPSSCFDWSYIRFVFVKF